MTDTSKFVRENRYLVIKWSDAHKALNIKQTYALSCAVNVLNAMRVKAGRGVLECVVVEKDWPEYEPTWEAIERRVLGDAASNVSVPEGFAITAQLDAMSKMSIRMQLAAMAMQGDWAAQWDANGSDRLGNPAPRGNGYFADLNEHGDEAQFDNAARLYFRMADSMLRVESE